ncbi:oxidoreductase [Asanoa ishikariensis]|uniref:zinc-binding dehydrogenase n=1 Tax=Asanoa ishikariensis TaxID=137265 RepID=UPI000A58F10F|nr:zinc-binding dehydrogenase [Asanoa ishikariensis]GIF64159.1 oxidoreductase [Asanoa ishikariensis]
MIEVHHASLNHGDLNDARSGRIPPGGVLGSDIAGVVVRAATDGTGPREGVRVVALAQGAFAERVAVDAASVATVPASVDLSVAAALPVAGLAPLRTLRACGSLLGKRVLVTGASGGVGSFAIQLAAAAGAHVIASVGSVERGAGPREAGADEVVVGLKGIDTPVDVVLDNVGGPQLVQAWSLLAPGGSLQSIGWTSGEPAVFAPYATVGPQKALSSYLTTGDAGSDLQTLVHLVETRVLTVRIGWRGSWDRFAEATEAMRQRRVNGKAVLDVATPGSMRTAQYSDETA